MHLSTQAVWDILLYGNRQRRFDSYLSLVPIQEALQGVKVMTEEWLWNAKLDVVPMEEIERRVLLAKCQIAFMMGEGSYNDLVITREVAEEVLRGEGIDPMEHQEVY